MDSTTLSQVKALLPLILEQQSRHELDIQTALEGTVRSTENQILDLHQQALNYKRPLEFEAYRAFNLDDYSDTWCFKYLRFTKEEIRHIIPLLHIDEIEYPNRRTPAAETAFCILLYRLSAPLRYKDLVPIFHYNKSSLSSIFNTVLMFLYHRYKNLLQ
jgi:hypothetical protein